MGQAFQADHHTQSPKIITESTCNQHAVSIVLVNFAAVTSIPWICVIYNKHLLLAP